ncbi:MAG: MFS transporter, partial [Firmicutes bacterium]|nr:MFS transporter [Bacillota bacterium]
MKLNYKRTIFVGFAFFLISLFWQAYDTIIPKMLTDKFGMSQSWSGVIMAIDNVLALFLLPLFGNLSDKCKSKSGRRTPFIKIGTILAVCFLLLLTFADMLQLKQLDLVAPGEPVAQEILYDADLTIQTPGGKEVVLQDAFSKSEYTAITMFDENGKTTADYTDYVVPARQAYAAAVTAENQTPLVVFVVLLLCLLLSMATFRSPAVALMPDVTIKPLRSKANAIINLMGALGGITVLVLGMVFGTGKAQNALMSYGSFFSCIGALMLIALLIFLWRVKEPKFVEEMEAESARLGLDTGADTPEEEVGIAAAETAPAEAPAKSEKLP